MNKVTALFKNNKIIKLKLPLFTLLLGLVTVVINPNISYTLKVIPQNTHAFMVAFGMMMVLCVGGIDLSIGYTISLISVIFGKLAEYNMFLAIATSLFIGLIIGIVNGILSWKTNIPYIVTLMTGFVLRGISTSLSNGESVIISMRLFSNDWALWLVCFMILLWGLLFKHTYLGKVLYAIGDCKEAVWLEAKVDVNYVKAYIICSLLGATAAIISSSRLGATSALMGSGWEADAIASCILSGCEFNGGTGEARDVFLGVLLFCLIKRILNYLSLPPEFYYVILGIIVLAYIEKPVSFNIKQKIRRIFK